jgi:hypothetical protein
MNKSFKNKPKLFFVNSCRGNQEMSAMDKIQLKRQLKKIVIGINLQNMKKF